MQQRKDFLIKFCYWAVIAVCVYAVFKYLLPVLFPFVLAYGIAYMLSKPVCRYELAMLFFTYSFFAWLAETAAATVKVRNFRNRGFASGPFSVVWGLAAVVWLEGM